MKPEVWEAIEGERVYQEQKWPGHQHTAGEWILIMDKCLNDAKRAWVTGHGDDSALHEVRQVVAVGVAAMEQCGAPRRNEPIKKTISVRAALCEKCGNKECKCRGCTGQKWKFICPKDCKLQEKDTCFGFEKKDKPNVPVPPPPAGMKP